MFSPILLIDHKDFFEILAFFQISSVSTHSTSCFFNAQIECVEKQVGGSAHLHSKYRKRSLSRRLCEELQLNAGHFSSCGDS